MNLLSINIRGMGETTKIDWIRRLRQNNKATHMCIQEAQLQSGVDETMVRNGWGDDNFGFEDIEVTGGSGDILTI